MLVGSVRITAQQAVLVAVVLATMCLRRAVQEQQTKDTQAAQAQAQVAVAVAAQVRLGQVVLLAQVATVSHQALRERQRHEQAVVVAVRQLLIRVAQAVRVAVEQVVVLAVVIYHYQPLGQRTQVVAVAAVRCWKAQRVRLAVQASSSFAN